MKEETTSSCPNCGAASDGSGTCAYCGTVYAKPAHECTCDENCTQEAQIGETAEAPAAKPKAASYKTLITFVAILVAMPIVFVVLPFLAVAWPVFAAVAAVLAVLAAREVVSLRSVREG